MSSSHSSDDDFSVGDRVGLSALGRERCHKYRSTTGVVVKVIKPGSRLRILLDDVKNQRTLHRTYLERLSETQ
jgi:hypothetical protein